MTYETAILFRPVGQKELDLIRETGWKGFPPRLFWQPDYLDRHEPHEAGGRELMEYWIPAEELAEFNDHIVGKIELVHEFRPEGEQQGHED